LLPFRCSSSVLVETTLPFLVPWHTCAVLVISSLPHMTRSSNTL